MAEPIPHNTVLCHFADVSVVVDYTCGICMESWTIAYTGRTLPAMALCPYCAEKRPIKIRVDRS